MPNIFAYCAVFLYPLVVIVLFRRLPRHEALIWSILGGYLFLPEQTSIDLPLLPELSKVLVPSLIAAIMCLVLPDAAAPARRLAQPAQTAAHNVPRRKNVLVNLCLLIMFLGPIGVFWANRDLVFAGPRVIAGLAVYDIFAMMLNAGVMLLPFVLARRYLATSQAQIALLRALVIGGVIYSVLILIEIRLSPQLNKWIYGFYSHSFHQHMRAGGFRPMVFIEHGLRVGIFMSMSCLAALLLWGYFRANTDVVRRDGRVRQNPATTYLLLGCWLFLVLFLCKTLGAFAIAALLMPVVVLAGVRMRLVVAALIAASVLIYPMLRQSNVIPTQSIVNVATAINPDRAQSLSFRLKNEDILLARAQEKPVFGWGGWGRSRIFNEITGREKSVTDGIWIIVFGGSGWLGYLAQFGLLVLPLFSTLRAKNNQVGLIESGLCLLLAANLIDLIPNSGLTPLTWLLAGSILGRSEVLRAAVLGQTPRQRAPNMVSARAPTPRHAHVRARQDAR